MRDNACCFTGHRKFSADKIESLIICLESEIEKLISNGVVDFISGGALGFDQIASSIIISKKEMKKDISLIFALLCRNQDKFWNEKDQSSYQNLLQKAD